MAIGSVNYGYRYGGAYPWGKPRGKYEQSLGVMADMVRNYLGQVAEAKGQGAEDRLLREISSAPDEETARGAITGAMTRREKGPGVLGRIVEQFNPNAPSRTPTDIERIYGQSQLAQLLVSPWDRQKRSRELEEYERKRRQSIAGEGRAEAAEGRAVTAATQATEKIKEDRKKRKIDNIYKSLGELNDKLYALNYDEENPEYKRTLEQIRGYEERLMDLGVRPIEKEFGMWPSTQGPPVMHGNITETPEPLVGPEPGGSGAGAAMGGAAGAAVRLMAEPGMKEALDSLETADRQKFEQVIREGDPEKIGEAIRLLRAMMVQSGSQRGSQRGSKRGIR